ncbi:hypothetical protein GC170_08205 [bacterium]|nr:hypothetical protein [bacterium]
MGDERQQTPSRLVWLNGLVTGFSIPSAFAIGASARADAEPSVGPLAGAVIQWADTIAFLVLIASLLRWFSKLGWVRAWFAAAPDWKP